MLKHNSYVVCSQLLDKHPSTPAAARCTTPDPQPTVVVQLSESEMLRAVGSFPAGQHEGRTESDISMFYRNVSCMHALYRKCFSIDLIH